MNSRLAQMIKTYISEGGNSIDIVSLEGNLFGTGTMEALRQVRPHLNSDFILLSCDLITEFPLHKMIDQHRTSDSLVTVMLAAAQAPAGKAEEANRYQDIEDNDVYAGMDESRKKLLYLEGKADIEDTIDFRMSLLNKFPCILLRTNLVDAHCYIFRKEFLEMLDSEEVFGKRKLFSVREELIPRLVKSQKVSAPSCREMALPGTNPGNTCAVRLVDGEFCVRVNNLKHYSEANRFICKSIPLGQPRVAATTEITGKAQVGNDSLAGEFTKLGDKTSVKRSIVGNNVVIGKNVKISNCIIMDKVVIEDKYGFIYFIRYIYQICVAANWKTASLPIVPILTRNAP